MTTAKPFTLIAAALFAIMAALHVYRIFTHFQVILGTHTISQGVSWLAAVVLGLLAYMLFRESRR